MLTLFGSSEVCEEINFVFYSLYRIQLLSFLHPNFFVPTPNPSDQSEAVQAESKSPSGTACCNRCSNLVEKDWMLHQYPTLDIFCHNFLLIDMFQLWE